MAQFDVHRNLGGGRERVPFVVVVQSRHMDGYQRRVVIPLVVASAMPKAEPNLNPRFEIASVAVVLHPLDILSIDTGRLGARVGSLASEGDRIIAAIDMVITQAWG